MTKEEPNNNNDFLGGLFLLLLIVPHAIIWFILFYKLIGKNKWLVLGSVAFSILTLRYLGTNFIADIQNLGKSLESVFNGSQNLFIFFLSIPLKYSFGSHLLIALLCLSTVATIKLFADDEELPIKSLKEAVKLKSEGNMNYRFNVAQNIPEETVIGFKIGKKAVTLQDKSKHIFVCGTTGTGKTVMLANFIESAINKNYPLFLIDGKGDTAEGSMLDIVERFKGDRKLYVVNMLNPSESDKYNPFRTATPTVVSDMLINLSDWSETHYKENTKRYLQKLAKLLTIAEIQLSFDSILEYMEPRKSTELLNNLLNEEKITKTEFERTRDLFKYSGEIAKNASARFLTLYESEVGEIFADNGVDIFTAIKENAIILFILNPLLYAETSATFGKLLLIDSKVAVSHSFTSKKERVFYILDEISSYASSNMIDLLNKSRSANLTCILATQSLSDLDDKGGAAFREQVIENCNNYVVLRQNSGINAELWANIFGTEETLEATYQISDETKGTGRGTVKKGRQYIFHPDEIKRLKTGEAFFMSKDKETQGKIQVRKGF